MTRDDWPQRLSKISTAWSALREAHGDAPKAATAAQQRLLECYGGAVYRYILAAVRDPTAAEDLTQEFALCLLRGDFRGADPQRGRFRNYVKGVLFHLVSKHREKQQKLPRSIPPDSDALAALVAAPDEFDRGFNETWREELLGRTWDALAAAQPTYHAMLRLRAEQPQMPSQDMAEHLSRRLGKPLTPDGVRQTLHRARDKFAALLVEEVAGSLEAATVEQVAQELADLGLLDSCRDALTKYAGRQGG